MKTYKTEGIILKRTNFSEADKILTVFTKHHGKLHLLAKGVRKITSRKAPNLEPFCLSRLFIVNAKNLDLVTETEIINNFSHLRRNLKKVAQAYQVCELVDKLAAEKQVNRSLFLLLQEELERLEQSSLDSYSLPEVTHKILWDLGYLPKNKVLPEDEIDDFVENVAERKIKSRQLLTRVEKLV